MCRMAFGVMLTALLGIMSNVYEDIFRLLI